MRDAVEPCSHARFATKSGKRAPDGEKNVLKEILSIGGMGAAGRAIEKGFGRQPIFTREGGSIPMVSTFQEELGLPSVLFGVGLPDENAHAPNEKLHVSNFHDGIIASAYLYDEVGRMNV